MNTPSHAGILFGIPVGDSPTGTGESPVPPIRASDKV